MILPKKIYKNMCIIRTHVQNLKKHLFLMTLLSFFSSFFDSIGILFFIPVIKLIESNGVIEKPIILKNLIGQHDNNSILIIFLGLILIFFVFKSIFYYITEIYIVRFINNYRVQWIDKLYSSYLKLKWPIFIQQEKGYLIDYILTVITRNSNLLLSLCRTISAVAAAGIYAVSAFIVSPKLTLYAILLISIPFLLYIKVIQLIKSHGRSKMNAGNELAKQTEQFITGTKIIKAYRVEEKVLELIHKIASNRRQFYIKEQKWKIGFRTFLELYVNIIFVSILYIFLIVYDFPIASIFVVLVFMLKLFQKTNQFVEIGNVAANIPGIQRLDKVFSSFIQHSENYNIKKEVKFDHYIQLQSVDYIYDSNNGEEFKALSNINFRIKSGDAIGIVGTSGAGKTTLIDLIFGLLIPSKGSIIIDGEKIGPEGHIFTKGIIAYVSQNPYLYSDTLLNNIKFFRSISNREINSSLKNSFSHEFINEKSEGIKSHIGDSGVKLSGGQRQRICLARALAGSPRIIILDEATSSLDSETEKYIQNSIDKIKKSTTLIIISHRISSVINCDYVYVMQGGKIIENGDPEGLLKNGTVFRKLASDQGISPDN